jgi:hypothetical protein
MYKSTTHTSKFFYRIAESGKTQLKDFEGKKYWLELLKAGLFLTEKELKTKVCQHICF